MEVYAAIVDNIDQNVGGSGALEELGELDNTLFIFTSDNGANAGGVEERGTTYFRAATSGGRPGRLRRTSAAGSVRPRHGPRTRSDGPCVVDAVQALQDDDDERRHPRPAGRALARRRSDAGAIRHQWLHVTDIVPTLLDVLGAQYPEAFNGYRTRALDGVSARPVLENAQANSSRAHQHYELAGNRGYIRDGWKIVSLQPPGKPLDLDNWMLFDLRTMQRRSPTREGESGSSWRELVAAFDADARANYVYPLDNRDVHRSLTVPPFLEAACAAPRTFLPGHAHRCWRRRAADRRPRLPARVPIHVRAGDDRGVVFALGDPLAGHGAFRARRRPLVRVSRRQRQAGGLRRLPARRGDERFEFAIARWAIAAGGGDLAMNGEACGTLDMSPTTILGLGVGEGLDVGLDRKLHVSDRYRRRWTLSVYRPGRLGAHRTRPPSGGQLRESARARGAARLTGAECDLRRASAA